MRPVDEIFNAKTRACVFPDPLAHLIRWTSEGSLHRPAGSACGIRSCRL